jgi:signal transduction histidine kinase
MPDEAAFGGLDWEIVTAGRVLTSIEALLAHFALLRDQLARERSEANVSLARNLGHDLTNVIATTKLDVGALATIAEQGPDRLGQSGRWELLEETVDSLRNNVSAMQEVVNIYRSFSYLRRPKFEECDVHTLVAEVADVLLLSTSLDVEIDLSGAPNATTVGAGAEPVLAEIEPRLLKLALFNLLTNSLEALKRRDTLPPDDPARAGAARPRIAIRAEAAGERCRLVVEDNGTGFRDAEGALLTEAALDKVFHLGFTTKSAEGEGLGLNWVWTIVHDIHGGAIHPEQATPGGARFVLELPARRA